MEVKEGEVSLCHPVERWAEWGLAGCLIRVLENTVKMADLCNDFPIGILYFAKAVLRLDSTTFLRKWITAYFENKPSIPVVQRS